MARLVSKKAAEMLGQPFVVESKQGAGGILGINVVLQAPADGYSLLFMDSSAYSITPHVFRKARFEPLKSLIPVAPVAVIPYVLAVNPALKVSTVKEFVAYAKQHPGLFYGSAGGGTPHHLAMEMFEAVTGIKVKHVPYKGANLAAMAVGAGDVSLAFLAQQSAASIAKSGKLKIIAVSTDTRMAQMPDIPTIAESGYPGFNISTTLGLVAPINTPPEIIAKLHRVVSEAARTKEVLDGIDSLGLIPAKPMTPTEYRKYATEEARTYGRLVEVAKAYEE